jgi:hypothetical protein
MRRGLLAASSRKKVKWNQILSFHGGESFYKGLNFYATTITIKNTTINSNTFVCIYPPTCSDQVGLLAPEFEPARVLRVGFEVSSGSA